MPDTTATTAGPMSIGDRIRAIAEEVDQRLAVPAGPPTPGSGPVDPGPELQPPSTPAAPRVVEDTLTQLVLVAEAATGPVADRWQVRDELNPATPLKPETDEPRFVRSPMRATSPPRRYSIRAGNAAGWSEWSAPLDVPAVAASSTSGPPSPGGGSAAGSALAALLLPADVFDLSRWYWTGPVADPSGRDSSGPWDVYQPDLDEFYDEFFRIVEVDGVRALQYTAPTRGVTTSGSGATRSELREMAGLGRKAGWGFDDGQLHQLTVTLDCDGTSIVGRREVSVGQIHGPGGTPPIILCVNHTRGALEVFRQGPRQGDLLTGLQPGERFTYRIRVAGGRCQVSAARGTVAALPVAPQFDFAAAEFTERTGLYFKAGAYNKQETASAAGGAAVVRQYRLDLV